MMAGRFLAVLLLLAGLAPAASWAQAGQGGYRLGPGDVVKVSVYRQSDLDTTAALASDGTVPIGTLGAVQLADLTAAAAGQRIADQLKRAGILVNPTVTVLVTEYHSRTVSVLGMVARPGEYPIDRDDLSLTEVLARAGATFDRGGTPVTIVPPAGSGLPTEQLHVADLLSGVRNRPVRRGESIFVQAPALVYVRGEVQRPGSYPIEPGTTIEQAVVLAGGLTQRGAMSRIRVTHADANGHPAAPVRARLSEAVQANDTIAVGARLF